MREFMKGRVGEGRGERMTIIAKEGNVQQKETEVEQARENLSTKIACEHSALKLTKQQNKHNHQ
jgi:hypothetical protein